MGLDLGAICSALTKLLRRRIPNGESPYLGPWPPSEVLDGGWPETRPAHLPTAAPVLALICDLLRSDDLLSGAGSDCFPYCLFFGKAGNLDFSTEAGVDQLCCQRWAAVAACRIKSAALWDWHDRHILKCHHNIVKVEVASPP